MQAMQRTRCEAKLHIAVRPPRHWMHCTRLGRKCVIPILPESKGPAAPHTACSHSTAAPPAAASTVPLICTDPRTDCAHCPLLLRSLLSPMAVDCLLKILDPQRPNLLDLKDVKVGVRCLCSDFGSVASIQEGSSAPTCWALFHAQLL